MYYYNIINHNYKKILKFDFSSNRTVRVKPM